MDIVSLINNAPTSPAIAKRVVAWLTETPCGTYDDGIVVSLDSPEGAGIQVKSVTVKGRRRAWTIQRGREVRLQTWSPGPPPVLNPRPPTIH